jgi:hypothetical protein
MKCGARQMLPRPRDSLIAGLRVWRRRSFLEREHTDPARSRTCDVECLNASANILKTEG